MKYHPLSGDNESPEDRRQNYIAIRCLGFLLITYLLVSTLITIVVDYSLGVENPVFRVESAAVYGLKVTDSYDLSATWNMTLLATNPNKQLAIDFDKVRVLVYYGSKEDVLYAHDEDNYILAKKQLSSPFALLTGDETRLNFKFGVVGATIGDWMALEISKEKKVSGSVKFGCGSSLSTGIGQMSGVREKPIFLTFTASRANSSSPQIPMTPEFSQIS